MPARAERYRYAMCTVVYYEAMAHVSIDAFLHE